MSTRGGSATAAIRARTILLRSFLLVLAAFCGNEASTLLGTEGLEREHRSRDGPGAVAAVKESSMTEKIALVLLAGPAMPCRMVHTLLWALDVEGRGGEVKIVLEGEAPGWLLELPDPAHGRHRLYEKVKSLGLMEAVCKACAVQAQAVEAAAAEGIRLVYDASGHVSLMPYAQGGYQIVAL